MDIEKLTGTEERLYQLVAPLTMSIPVLRQNNNYPFKTSVRHVWFVASEEGKVKGFIPVEKKDSCFYIDNYYVSGENYTLLSQLITRITQEYSQKSKPLRAVVHAPHIPIFEALGFSSQKEWKRYSKMIYLQV